MKCNFVRLAARLLSISSLIVTVSAINATNAESGYLYLQKWYNSNIGLWMYNTGWWNSANCLTTIANLAAIDGAIKSAATQVFPNTFTKAQQFNSGGVSKTVSAQTFEVNTFYTDTSPEKFRLKARMHARANTGFLNDYYDDEGWWALAWIAVYDITGNTNYLSAAETIFADFAKVYGTTPCGGLWWDKAHTYVNAIANELFIAVAASLANRASSSTQKSKAYYLDYANRGWTWFQKSGMINSGYTINDGLTSKCVSNGGTVWSYNQGVILGGLVELSKATGSTSYITTAQKIADAAIQQLSSNNNGILREPCEPRCGNDGSQFKGIFVRNLAKLYKASPRLSYKTFLTKQADTIWANDRNSSNAMSLVWAGPFVTPANASTHSSALDALVAGLAVK